MFTDFVGPVVADASTAINLNATACASRILKAFPNKVLIERTVITELDRGRFRGRIDADLTAGLISEGLIEVVTLGPSALAHFENLTVGSAVETLDDGEAAAIACALDIGAIPVIDERKAHRICGQRFPDLRLASTVDLLSHASIRDELGHDELADAIARALLSARMRVLSHHIEWVVSTIGAERAADCPSLPKRVRQPA